MSAVGLATGAAATSQGLAELGGALRASGGGGLADRVGRAFDQVGHGLGEVIEFALENPAPTTLGVGVFVVVAVLWAIRLR